MQNDLFWLPSSCLSQVKILVVSAILKSKVLYGMESAQVNEPQLKLACEDSQPIGRCSCGWTLREKWYEIDDVHRDVAVYYYLFVVHVVYCWWFVYCTCVVCDCQWMVYGVLFVVGGLVIVLYYLWIMVCYSLGVLCSWWLLLVYCCTCMLIVVHVGRILTKWRWRRRCGGRCPWMIEC